MRRAFTSVPFERYADDAIVHCVSRRKPSRCVRRSRRGWPSAAWKTRIVYCKQDGRPGSYEHESFDFLGYTFRARKAKDKHGGFFTSFLPAVSNAAAKAKRQEIRRWRLHLWTDKSLRDIAAVINPIVRGWINCYGRFYRSRLSTTALRQINEYLIRWAMRKDKGLRSSQQQAARLLARIARSDPDLFGHWWLVRLGTAG